MEAEAKYTYVGLALIGLVVALLGGLVWLKNSGRSDDFRSYVINFERQPLDGLQLGADVNLRGIKVGRVEDYSLVPGQINRVRVVIRVDKRTPISENTVAVVSRNFVTGLAKIGLVILEPPGKPLEPAPDEKYAVIAEGKSDLDELAGKVNRLGDMAADAIDNLNQVLQPENRAAFAQTVNNLRDLTAGLNQRLAAVDKTISTVNAVASDVGRAGTRVASTAEKVEQDLQPALVQADTTLKSLSDAAHTLDKQTAALAKRFDQAANSTDDQLTVMTGELRATVDSLNRVLDKFQDPKAAVLGPGKGQLGPGERNP